MPGFCLVSLIVNFCRSLCLLFCVCFCGGSLWGFSVALLLPFSVRLCGFGVRLGGSAWLGSASAVGGFCRGSVLCSGSAWDRFSGSASVGVLWFSASAVGSVGVLYLPKQRNPKGSRSRDRKNLFLYYANRCIANHLLARQANAPGWSALPGRCEICTLYIGGTHIGAWRKSHFKANFGYFKNADRTLI